MNMTAKKNLSFIVITICALWALLLLPGIVGAENIFEKGLNLFTGADDTGASGELTTDEVSNAFKQALKIGAENVVEQLGREGGFNADEAVHIPLPQQLKAVKTTLAQFGMESMVDDLELKLNRAAEEATPKAKAVFFEAISEMTFQDVMDIYNGPKDAATTYFRDKMSPRLAEEMRPIAEKSLSEVGAVRAYDKVMDKYTASPFVPDIKTDLTDYVLREAMDGIFYYMAKEEAAIRENPARQTTALLKKVFGTE